MNWKEEEPANIHQNMNKLLASNCYETHASYQTINVMLYLQQNKSKTHKLSQENMSNKISTLQTFLSRYIKEK